MIWLLQVHVPETTTSVSNKLSMHTLGSISRNIFNKSRKGLKLVNHLSNHDCLWMLKIKFSTSDIFQKPGHRKLTPALNLLIFHSAFFNISTTRNASKRLSGLLHRESSGWSSHKKLSNLDFSRISSQSYCPD